MRISGSGLRDVGICSFQSGGFLIHFRNRRLFWLLLAVAGFFPKTALSADPQPDPDLDESETAIQKAARELVQSIDLVAVIGTKREELELLKQPVLRFGDVERANDKGSVWIWQRAGQPQAIMELYRGADGRSWIEVIHSLSADGLEGNFGNGVPRWIPVHPGVEWQKFPDAPTPAEGTASRARQMKELAQQFSAHEFWDPENSRYELRLLIRPVHTYSKSSSGRLDGALFLLCHGTNPEVPLLIESVDDGAGPRFRYALARLGHAELHVSLDGKEVWHKDRVEKTDVRDPYWLHFHSAAP